MEVIHPRCAGIDVSKKDAKVCVRVQGAGRRGTSTTVTTWGSTTGDILALGEHLLAEQVSCVVIESTSDYWKPFYYLLEDQQLPVILVNAKAARNVPGRKTDVSDAAWLADLGAHGQQHPRRQHTRRGRDPGRDWRPDPLRQPPGAGQTRRALSTRKQQRHHDRPIADLGAGPATAAAGRLARGLGCLAPQPSHDRPLSIFDYPQHPPPPRRPSPRRDRCRTAALDPRHRHPQGDLGRRRGRRRRAAGSGLTSPPLKPTE